MPTSFAVVVTNYNYARFVLEAVESALGQTRAPHRVIVIDDGSSDDSAARLAAAYGDDPRVELVFSPNRGQLAGFANGAARAQADVVCFLDADDLWEPHYLAALGTLYDARPDVDFVFSNLRKFGRAGDIEAFAEQEEDLGYTAVMTWLTGAWYGASTSALSMRRDWALRCTDFPEPFMRMWRICADACVHLSAGVYGARKYYLPTNGVRYRIHGENAWHSHQTAASDYRESLAKRCTLNHCAERIGLQANCAALLPLEFATKPNPSAREIARYRDLMDRLAHDPGSIAPLEHLPTPRRHVTPDDEGAHLPEAGAAPQQPPTTDEPQPGKAPLAVAAFLSLGRNPPLRRPRRYLRDVLRVVLQKPNL